MTDRRNKIGPALMSAIQVLRFKLRKDGTIQDTMDLASSWSESEVLHDMISYWKTAEDAPEDLPTFRAALREARAEAAS